MLKQMLAASVAVAGVSVGAVTKIQPNEAASQDTFVYAFSDYAKEPGTVLAPSGNVIAVTNSVNHTMLSLIRFDLGGATLVDGESAYLRLKIRDAYNPGSANPSADFPARVKVHVATGAWDESVTWNGQPTYNASEIVAENVTGIDQWVSFDITHQVAAWLASPLTNFGVVLTQDQRVHNGIKEVGVFFHGAGYGVESDRPMLEIIPEPASLTLIGLAGATLLRRRRV